MFLHSHIHHHFDHHFGLHFFFIVSSFPNPSSFRSSFRASFFFIFLHSQLHHHFDHHFPSFFHSQIHLHVDHHFGLHFSNCRGTPTSLFLMKIFVLLGFKMKLMTCSIIATIRTTTMRFYSRVSSRSTVDCSHWFPILLPHSNVHCWEDAETYIDIHTYTIHDHRHQNMRASHESYTGSNNLKLEVFSTASVLLDSRSAVCEGQQTTIGHEIGIAGMRTRLGAMLLCAAAELLPPTFSEQLPCQHQCFSRMLSTICKFVCACKLQLPILLGCLHWGWTCGCTDILAKTRAWATEVHGV